MCYSSETHPMQRHLADYCLKVNDAFGIPSPVPREKKQLSLGDTCWMPVKNCLLADAEQ